MENKAIPKDALRKLEGQRFIRYPHSSSLYVRRCDVHIKEEDAATWIDPESFDFKDVYGNCTITQGLQVINGGAEVVITPVVFHSYEHEKNFRSWEREACKDLPHIGHIPGNELEVIEDFEKQEDESSTIIVPIEVLKKFGLPELPDVGIQEALTMMREKTMTMCSGALVRTKDELLAEDEEAS